MNDSRDFKDAESVRSGLSHVPSQLAFFPLFRDLGGMLSRSVGMPSQGHNMVHRETFLQIQPRLLQKLIQGDSIRGFPMSRKTHHRM